MTPYTALGKAIGTREAVDLAQRLAAWHDAMVMHRRRSGMALDARCPPDCPHVTAELLWREAQDIYGDRAHELEFLRSHGGGEGAAQPAHAQVA